MSQIEQIFVAVPYGTRFDPSGAITFMPSGDFSYNVQDSTNAIIDNQNQIINDLLSPSGDSASIFLPSVNVSGDSTENFFSFVVENMQNVFLNNNEATFVLPLLNQEFILTSLDFKVVPQAFEPLFVSFHYFWVGVLIFKDVRKMFENLKNGNIEKIASEDLTANMV